MVDCIQEMIAKLSAEFENSYDNYMETSTGNCSLIKIIWYQLHNFTRASFVWLKILSNDFGTDLNWSEKSNIITK